MTLRLTDAERDLALKPEPTLSRVPPGHWRCVFFVPAFVAIVKLAEPLGDGLWRSFTRHVSREVAEEQGRKSAANFNAWFELHGHPAAFRFERADYFPGERP